MLSVPISSYDPVFSLYHCNIDRLYEEWLDQYSDDSFSSYQPNKFYYDIAPGHNIDEFRVPMFPLITNGYAQQSKITRLYLQGRS